MRNSANCEGDERVLDEARVLKRYLKRLYIEEKSEIGLEERMIWSKGKGWKVSREADRQSYKDIDSVQQRGAECVSSQLQ